MALLPIPQAQYFTGLCIINFYLGKYLYGLLYFMASPVVSLTCTFRFYGSKVQPLTAVTQLL